MLPSATAASSEDFSFFTSTNAVMANDSMMVGIGNDEDLLFGGADSGSQVLAIHDLSEFIGNNNNSSNGIVSGHSNNNSTASSRAGSDVSAWSGDEEKELSTMLDLGDCFGGESIVLFGEEQEEVVPSSTSVPGTPPPQQQQQEFRRDPKTKLYHCQHCPKSFQYVSRLQRHASSHQGKQFRCEVCDKLFSRVDVLASHRNRIHNGGIGDNNGNVDDNDINAYPCPHCPSRLKSRHHLERHLRAHVDRVGDFACEFCGKAFTVKHKFQRHLRLHLVSQFRIVVCPLVKHA